MEDNSWLRELLASMDAKVDRLAERMESMAERHVDNTENLREHMLRSELNEENIELLREQMQPVVKKLDMVEGVLKAIGGIAVLAGIVEGTIKAVEFFGTK